VKYKLDSQNVPGMALMHSNGSKYRDKFSFPPITEQEFLPSAKKKLVCFVYSRMTSEDSLIFSVEFSLDSEHLQVSCLSAAFDYPLHYTLGVESSLTELRELFCVPHLQCSELI
jgi:hypothetical protein